LLGKLGSDSPVTLGASRSPDACGSQLYRRNISPWLDRRHSHLNTQSRMFILYKLFTREICFWKDIARKRERNGVSCCRLCAALGEQNICMACEQFLAHDNKFDWFRNAILGEPPLRMKTLSEEEVKARLGNLQWQEISRNGHIFPEPHGYSVSSDGNIDWAEKLDFYSKLDEPFNDISELALQWQEFAQYCRKILPYNLAKEVGNRKRKRSERPDPEKTDGSSENLEVPDEDNFREGTFDAPSWVYSR